MSSIMDIIAHETGGKSYKTYKYICEGSEILSFDYDDHQEITWEKYGETFPPDKAISMLNICAETKHTDAEDGVCCFYLNCDDIEAHKRVIKYFLENDLIRKTKTGKLYNISFKLDDQTRLGEYGTNFHSEIKLEQFVDLNTGEFV